MRYFWFLRIKELWKFCCCWILKVLVKFGDSCEV